MWRAWCSRTICTMVNPALQIVRIRPRRVSTFPSPSLSSFKRWSAFFVTYMEEQSIETDHKPLEHIFRKPLTATPPRLQRMMLMLQKYELMVSYKLGKSLFIADTLSSPRSRNSNHGRRISGSHSAQLANNYTEVGAV